jgi:xanthine dehydrogenase iron-sulfur cluster and FAD-binding subunit A
MCAAYGQASGVPDPINLIEDLGVRGSLIITRPALSHYMSNRSEIDAAAKSVFDAVAQGVVAVLRIEGGLVAGPRIGVGGAEAMPRRSLAAEAVLSGRRPSEVLLREAAAAAAAVDPIEDAHTNAHYRRELVGTMVYRALAAINPGWLDVTRPLPKPDDGCMPTVWDHDT